MNRMFKSFGCFGCLLSIVISVISIIVVIILINILIKVDYVSIAEDFKNLLIELAERFNNTT